MLKRFTKVTTLLDENFAVFLGKIAFRSILILRFRQNYEFHGSNKRACYDKRLDD